MAPRRSLSSTTATPCTASRANTWRHCGFAPSVNTERVYAGRLALFLTYCADNRLDWRSITVQDLAGFQSWLVPEPIPRRSSGSNARHGSSKTTNAVLTSVCEFLRFASTRGWFPPELAQQVSPHLSRPSAATRWLESGTPRDVVQALLGHVSSASTSCPIYAQWVRRLGVAITLRRGSPQPSANPYAAVEFLAGTQRRSQRLQCWNVFTASRRAFGSLRMSAPAVDQTPPVRGITDTVL